MERKWIHSWWRRARKSRDWLKWKLALHVSIIHTFLERSMPAPITAHRRIHQLMYYSPSFPMPFILLPLANIYSKNEKKDKVSSCQRIPPSLSFTLSLSPSRWSSSPHFCTSSTYRIRLIVEHLYPSISSFDCVCLVRGQLAATTRFIITGRPFDSCKPLRSTLSSWVCPLFLSLWIPNISTAF